MKKSQILFSILTLALIMNASSSKAEEIIPIPLPTESESNSAAAEDMKVVEAELEKAKDKKQTPAVEDTLNSQVDPKTWDYSTLGKLAPFSEVSVIQKRFMPKTNRLQLSAALAAVTNDPFFNTTGATIRVGYFFNETYGVEANYFSMSTSKRQTTEELGQVQGVKTDQLVYLKSFSGLDFVYSPIYGKISWFNKRIVPFDMFFNIGYGVTGTQSGENPGTLHLGTGQLFALTKATAFRWDFNWNFFQAKGIETTASNFNTLFLSLGFSFFYPEAKYR